jgi:hypothetical protein
MGSQEDGRPKHEACKRERHGWEPPARFEQQERSSEQAFEGGPANQWPNEQLWQADAKVGQQRTGCPQ